MIRETHVIVAEADAGIAGFASVALHPTGSLVAGEVDQLFVHPTYTNLGVASLLLEAIETEARQAGLDRLVTHASLRAAALFVQTGYRPQEEETVQIDDQWLARFLMRKELRS
jgi:putative acetyltransferase